MRLHRADLLPLTMLVCVVVLLPGFIMWRYVHDPVAGRHPSRAASSEFGDSQLSGAIDRLFLDIDPDHSSNRELPAFARDNVRWLLTRYRERTLAITLVDAFRKPAVTHDGLMMSRGDDGRPTIAIARSQLVRLLAEGNGRAEGPFTAEQRNDFMLGVVHQAVHLRQSATDALGVQASQDIARTEERRVWRALTLNIVRPLRLAGAPLHSTYIEVDDAFRRCNDRIDGLQLPTFAN